MVLSPKLTYDRRSRVQLLFSDIELAKLDQLLPVLDLPIAVNPVHVGLDPDWTLRKTLCPHPHLYSNFSFPPQF